MHRHTLDNLTFQLGKCETEPRKLTPGKS